MSRGDAVPVLMYHGIGPAIPGWRWNGLVTPADVFEDHLRWLVRKGYRAADLDGLHRHVSGEATLPSKSVVLTFDDGYLDNWVYAAPLLERYGFRGTVFVNPDFVDPRDVVRPTLRDVCEGGKRIQDLESRGFLSWTELSRLTASGMLLAESHLLTHTWYPVGSEVVDFHHPGDGHYWLDWNARPESKPFYLLDPDSSRVPWGVPIYEHRKSVEAHRYRPDPGEADSLAAYVASRGGAGFFTGNGWREELRGQLAAYRGASGLNGSFETDDERRARLIDEVIGSKRILEERLGRPVRHLCWPGGGYDELARGTADAHYLTTTLRSVEDRDKRNRPGEDPRRIRRWSAPDEERAGAVHWYGGRYLVQYLDEFRGVPFAKTRRLCLKLISKASR